MYGVGTVFWCRSHLLQRPIAAQSHQSLRAASPPAPRTPNRQADADVILDLPSGFDEAAIEQGLQKQSAEKRAERKVLAHLLPPLFLFSFLNYVDRSNLAFASIPLERDLGFNNRVFGLASGVFFATYAGLQIPSQMLAVRLGGPAILGLLAISWGFVAAGLAGVRNEAGLLAQRVMLGAVEAGALPAMWMVNSHVSCWLL